MGYYGRGDYYRGDHYAAGGLGSFLGKAFKGVLGGVGGFLTGGPVGAVKGAATGLGLIRTGQTLPQIGPTSQSLIPTFGPGTVMSVPEPGITGTAHRLFAGGKPGFGRLKKDGSFTDRRAPRMNVTNVRALRRAGRRVRGFLKIASRLGALPIARGGGKKLFKRKHR